MVKSKPKALRHFKVKQIDKTFCQQAESMWIFCNVVNSGCLYVCMSDHNLWALDRFASILIKNLYARFECWKSRDIVLCRLQGLDKLVFLFSTNLLIDELMDLYRIINQSINSEINESMNTYEISMHQWINESMNH